MAEQEHVSYLAPLKLQQSFLEFGNIDVLIYYRKVVQRDIDQLTERLSALDEEINRRGALAE